MIPYNKVSSKLIKPRNLYTNDINAKRYFLALFGNDENSFKFLQGLIDYANEKNLGEWPEKITPEIVAYIHKRAQSEFSIEEMKIFTDGYVFKNGKNYEITHEFVVGCFMTCSDGNFVPLSTGHIDFTNEERISTFLRESVQIKEPQAVKFFTKLALEMAKKSGTLVGETISLERGLEIAHENDLIFDLCIEWGQSRNLVAFNAKAETIICNALMWSVYTASPRLN